MNETLTELEYIGSFAVDSGQAMVGDPCYLDEWQKWDSETTNFEEHTNKGGEYGYLGACNATLTNSYGTLGAASSVVFNTGYGDGLYPVYAKFNEDGRISMVVIDFEDNVEGEDE
jgi:hypothetical protein